MRRRRKVQPRRLSQLHTVVLERSGLAASVPSNSYVRFGRYRRGACPWSSRRSAGR